jgi:hypothetical protein
MKITIESTTKIVTLNGIECRIWEGATERGVKLHAYIPRVAVRDDLDTSQFEAELREHAAPTAEILAIPLRLLI